MCCMVGSGVESIQVVDDIVSTFTGVFILVSGAHRTCSRYIPSTCILFKLYTEDRLPVQSQIIRIDDTDFPKSVQLMSGPVDLQ